MSQFTQTPSNTQGSIPVGELVSVAVDMTHDVGDDSPPPDTSSIPEPKKTPSKLQNRWFGLSILSLALAIIILDNSILNIAIPTIETDFGSSLSDLQWVISGYSLIVATFLVTFGRLGDLYGRRRLFLLGAALFALGSYLASISYSSLDLFIGDALIEGIGAAMMLPATLSLISSMFQGRERGVAFAVWGAIAGAAGAFGPLLGGWLTSDYSWRWAFRINLIIAPIAIIGALISIRESRDTTHRQSFDVAGMITASVGLFLLVFSLIEGQRFGWWGVNEALMINGWQWPFTVSFIPFVGAIGVIIIGIFVALEHYKEQHGQQPLFEPSLLHYKGFRYGLLTTVILSMGEFGLVFVLPIFLQAARQFSAIETGLALLPLGLAVIGAAGFAGGLSRRFGPKWLITGGMVMEACGIFLLIASLNPETSAWQLIPGLVLYGAGVGFATTQLTSVVLSDIPVTKSGVASGVNGTVRQIGTALGIAIIGSILTSQITTNNQATTIQNHTPVGQAIASIVTASITDASRMSSLFAGIVVSLGALLSLAIPNIQIDQKPKNS
jgi:EmrB/QacA subfamily drug resistance transporter